MPLPSPERFLDLARADRVQRELRDAIAKLPPAELSAWGRRSSLLFRDASVRRARELLNFGGSVLRWSKDEAVALGSETRAGRGLTHLSGRLRALRDGTTAVATSARQWLGVTARALRHDPRKAAPQLATAVIGFFMGGSNPQVDQAMTGVDIARNLRSPASLASDVVAGAVLEAGIAAMADLARVLADYLPADRDPLWDQLNAGRHWVQQAMGHAPAAAGREIVVKDSKA
jgi:hypothetical protein